jgi:hypothetical protein
MKSRLIIVNREQEVSVAQQRQSRTVASGRNADFSLRFANVIIGPIDPVGTKMRHLSVWRAGLTPI